MHTPHIDRPRLGRRIAALRSAAVSFTGVIFRSTTPKYATENDFVTGEGSHRHGGRWNPPGLAAVYGSFSPETAMAETLAQHRYYRLPVENAMPRTFVAIEVRLQRVLDLSDGAIRRRLGVSARRIQTGDWRRENGEGREALTQAIGMVVASAGFEAIRAPSAQVPVGGNLIVFPEMLGKTSRIRVSNPERL